MTIKPEVRRNTLDERERQIERLLVSGGKAAGPPQRGSRPASSTISTPSA